VWTGPYESIRHNDFMVYGGVMLAIKAEIVSEPVVDIDTPCPVSLLHARSIATLMIVSL
jgi:hypothetical protein